MPLLAAFLKRTKIIFLASAAKSDTQDLFSGAVWLGAINNWLRKSSAAPWKSLTQTQQSEAQLNVVVKDGEEIGATILYSQKTPTRDTLTGENGPGQGHQQYRHWQLSERRN